MKRSEINSLIDHAKKFMAEYRFALPPFAYWSADDWKRKGPESVQIVQGQLGWDITDFGSGDFAKVGLLLCTVRNGQVGQSGIQAKTYAEKIMIVREKQVTPCHFHHQKMEDIINRGGGKLVLELWNADDRDGLAATPVRASIDGTIREIASGAKVTLCPGESITLPPRMYHRFWAEGGITLVGEVSRVNDDRTDNRFHDPVGRFPAIEEDATPTHLLVTDYSRYYSYGA